MLNDCLRCHKSDYLTDSTHWHYCNDCVKICTTCSEVKALWSFNFNFKSDEYKRWKNSNCYGFMNASGHLDECASCDRKVLEALQPVKNLETKGKIEFVMTPAMLQLMQDAMREPTRTTERPDTA
jgi:hypothetical protein